MVATQPAICAVAVVSAVSFRRERPNTWPLHLVGEDRPELLAVVDVRRDSAWIEVTITGGPTTQQSANSPQEVRRRPMTFNENQRSDSHVLAGQSVFSASTNDARDHPEPGLIVPLQRVTAVEGLGGGGRQPGETRKAFDHPEASTEHLRLLYEHRVRPRADRSVDLDLPQRDQLAELAELFPPDLQVKLEGRAVRMDRDDRHSARIVVEMEAVRDESRLEPFDKADEATDPVLELR